MTDQPGGGLAPHITYCAIPVDAAACWTGLGVHQLVRQRWLRFVEIIFRLRCRRFGSDSYEDGRQQAARAGSSTDADDDHFHGRGEAGEVLGNHGDDRTAGMHAELNLGGGHLPGLKP